MARAEPSRALVPSLVLLGMVVAVISSLGAPLVPSIAVAYGVSPGSAQWSLTVALLAGAVTAPVVGRLGDGPRRRAVVLGVLGAVVLGSVLSALPLGFAALLAGRGLQGVGLGLVPLAMTVARDALGPVRARSAVAVLAVTGSAGVGLGYPVTGLLADSFGVHGPFVLGAATAAVTLLLMAVVLPSSAHLVAHPLDRLGALLLGAGLIALLLCLAEGGSWGWASPRLAGVGLVAVVVLGLFGAHELRTPFPLVDLRLLRERSLLVVNASTLLTGVGIYLVLTLVTRFVQAPPSAGYGFGASVLVAGLVLLPFSLASVTASRVLPGLARLVGRRWVLPVASASLGTAMVVIIAGRTHLWAFFVVLGVAGLGSGLVFAAVARLVTRTVPPRETGSALGLNQVVRQIGFSVGSAVGGATLAGHTPAGTALPTVTGYLVAAWIGLGVCVAAAVLGAALPSGVPPDAPEVQEVPGQASRSAGVHTGHAGSPTARPRS